MTDVINSIVERADSLVKIIASSPMRGECKKAVLRRIEGGRFTLERFIGDKAFHATVEPTELEKCLKTQVLGDFKQTEVFFADSVTTVLTNKKGTVTVKTKKAAGLMQVAEHNRKKRYALSEGEDIPALRDLGIFTKENKVAAPMRDKYRQINRFIETVDDVFSSFEGELTVLDFGCGKSYLTFVLYYYLTVKKGLKTQVIGYDLKEDVVNNCNETAKKYGYDGLKFVRADVKEDKLYDQKIDMIVSLHACDTATDYALSYAVQKKVKYIFSVPCCQHEINSQIRRGGDFDIFLRHGLIKERFSALLTDAIRAEALQNAGYRVDCLEFVGFDASPKNLMLRAVLTGNERDDNREEEQLLKKYSASQTLLNLLKQKGERIEQEVTNGKKDV